MTPLRAFRKTLFVFAVAFACAIGAGSLPDNPYQRWQLTDGTIYDQLRWAYERIHFDERPVDIAIVGPSRTLLGLSDKRIDDKLASIGVHVNTANFSVVAEGRNVQWEIVKELFKAKKPKVIVIEVNEKFYNFAHQAFPLIAPTSDLLLPPGLIQSHYMHDLLKLPMRQLKLFVAGIFPEYFGLRRDFDKDIYLKTPSNFTSGSVHLDGKIIDMENKMSPEVLRMQRLALGSVNIFDKFLLSCCLHGDDFIYIRDMVRLANQNGASVIFDYFPIFGGEAEPSNINKIDRFGLVISNGDLSSNPNVFANWSHFNHEGANIASDRLAKAIYKLYYSNASGENLTNE